MVLFPGFISRQAYKFICLKQPNNDTYLILVKEEIQRSSFNLLQNKIYMLWCNFILGLNFISLCFGVW